MRIDNQLIWCVCDPGPDSELAALPRYTIGTGLETWEAERTTLYDDEAEARADARERLARVRR